MLPLLVLYVKLMYLKYNRFLKENSKYNNVFHADLEAEEKRRICQLLIVKAN